MRLTEEDRAILTEHCGSFDGCCGNDNWRGHACSYHEGWIEGWDKAVLAVERGCDGLKTEANVLWTTPRSTDKEAL